MGAPGRQMQKNIDFLFVPVGEGATPPRGPQEAHPLGKWESNARPLVWDHRDVARWSPPTNRAVH